MPCMGVSITNYNPDLTILRTLTLGGSFRWLCTVMMQIPIAAGPFAFVRCAAWQLHMANFGTTRLSSTYRTCHRVCQRRGGLLNTGLHGAWWNYKWVSTWIPIRLEQCMFHMAKDELGQYVEGIGLYWWSTKETKSTYSVVTGRSEVVCHTIRACFVMQAWVTRLYSIRISAHMPITGAPWWIPPALSETLRGYRHLLASLAGVFSTWITTGSMWWTLRLSLNALEVRWCLV